ncbi:MAG: hypothetical protein N4A38_01910 [Candidatus Gracilibacteria bacterium]|nr:hypothetical protein [Candidatus Gracilibacteria bacterium]
MKNKILFTTNEALALKIAKKFNLEQEKTNIGVKIFSGSINNEDRIILCLSGESKDEVLASLTYIHDNYEFIKFINLGELSCVNNFEYKTGDIVIPNTFMANGEDMPIFLSSMPEGNYELEDYGVIFNGICFSCFCGQYSKEEVEECADMCDKESYFILKFFSGEEDFDEKFLMIKLYGDLHYYDNLISVLKMVL